MDSTSFPPTETRVIISLRELYLGMRISYETLSFCSENGFTSLDDLHRHYMEYQNFGQFPGLDWDINAELEMPKEKRAEVTTKAMVYFPEVFSNRPDKFSRLAIWLVTSEAIFCPNIRDLFSAGGREDFIIHEKKYQNVPQIFTRLCRDIKNIQKVLMNTPDSNLAEFWHYKTSEVRVNLVVEYSKSVKGAEHLNFEEIFWKLIHCGSKT